MFLKTIYHNFEQAKQQLSLRSILLVSFLVQILGTVGIVQWLSIYHGSKAIQSLAIQLNDDVTLLVADHIEDYLEIPKQINQINQDAISTGLLDIQEFDKIGHFFWKQIHQFQVSYINFGTPQGELVGVERKPNKTFGIDFLTRSQPGILREYQADPQGNPIQLLNHYPYDHRQESWYTDAVTVGQPTWSEVYHWDGLPEILAISASYPIYDETGQLMGVLGVDQTLTDISQFLQQKNIHPNGSIFIIERSGMLVASSSQHPPFILENNQAQSLSALEIEDQLIQKTAQLIIENFKAFNQINQSESFEFKFNHEKYFVQILPWKDELGLDWLIIVVIPESHFFSQIHANTRQAILLGLLAATFAAYLAILTAQCLTRPVQHLSLAATAIAQGNLDHRVGNFSIQEFQILGDAFNQMSKQLKTSFNQLEKNNQKLEKRVEQRTVELKLSEEKFAKAFWASPDIITINSLENGEFIEVNESFCRVLGYPQEVTLGQTSLDLNLWVNPNDYHEFTQQLKQNCSLSHHEVQLLTHHHQIITVELSAQVIDINQKQYGLIVANDITKRKHYDTQLQASLQEKEVLLREIHHRVKNNLHIISSLLDLQSNAIQDEQVLDLFTDSQSRIQSMALIHEQLYQSQDLGNLNFGDYIHRLMSNIFCSFADQMSSIQSQIEIEPIQLNLETAIPCGLLINELVTNSFKHAFPNQKKGKIKIDLHADKHQVLHLEISDNGIGIPSEIDWQNSTSLGLRLVQILSKQIKATVKTNFTQGTCFHLTFSPLQYKARF